MPTGREKAGNMHPTDRDVLVDTPRLRAVSMAGVTSDHRFTMVSLWIEEISRVCIGQVVHRIGQLGQKETKRDVHVASI